MEHLENIYQLKTLVKLFDQFIAKSGNNFYNNLKLLNLLHDNLMSKRNIIIIVILTIILVTAAVTLIYTKPSIEDIRLSSDKNPVTDKPEKNNSFNFKKSDTDIYLIIEVRHITAKDEIKVLWEKVENDSGEIIQKNIVYPENDGSGKIIISLVKKNDIYTPGTHTVTVYLNGDMKAYEKFFISE